MANHQTFSLLIFTLLLFNRGSSSFTPIDNYLINCGSTFPSIPDSNNRNFVGDESTLPESVKLTATRTIPLTESHGSTRPEKLLYNSVRLFTKPATYSFKINQIGAHFVRFHFHGLNFDKFDGKDLRFRVLCNDFVLFNDFNLLGVRNNVEISEFILWVDSDHLELSFIPVENSNFGFISAIEVISAPKDLILDVAQLVNFDGVSKIDGMVKNGYESVFRVNVGGPKITPFNDTLWRTWINDEEFLGSSVASKEVRFSGRIRYLDGGASHEVAPDHVYGSARVITGLNSSVSWRFPVVDGYKYLVRTHFCDIVSRSLGSLYFNVYVNGVLAYEDLDLSSITGSLASPFYADFVVDGGAGVDGVVTVSVGNSSLGGDAILNGVEVFKMSNSMKSFDGMVSAESVLRSCHEGNGGFPFLFVIAIGILLAVSLLLRRILATVQESVSWSRLPTDISEVALKSSYR